MQTCVVLIRMPEDWDKTVHVDSINSEDLWFLPKGQDLSGYCRELDLKFRNLWSPLEDCPWPRPQPVAVLQEGELHRHVNYSSGAPGSHVPQKEPQWPLRTRDHICSSSLTGFDRTSAVFLIVTCTVINRENHEK